MSSHHRCCCGAQPNECHPTVQIGISTAQGSYSFRRIVTNTMGMVTIDRQVMVNLGPYVAATFGENRFSQNNQPGAAVQVARLSWFAASAGFIGSVSGFDNVAQQPIIDAAGLALVRCSTSPTQPSGWIVNAGITLSETTGVIGILFDGSITTPYQPAEIASSSATAQFGMNPQCMASFLVQRPIVGGTEVLSFSFNFNFTQLLPRT